MSYQGAGQGFLEGKEGGGRGNRQGSTWTEPSPIEKRASVACRAGKVAPGSSSGDAHPLLGR